MSKMLWITITIFMFLPESAESQEARASSNYGISLRELSKNGCCKVCTLGKACGDSCINSSYNCNRGTGCACNASTKPLPPLRTPTPKGSNSKDNLPNTKRKEQKVRCPKVIGDMNTGLSEMSKNRYQCFRTNKAAARAGFSPTS